MIKRIISNKRNRLLAVVITATLSLTTSAANIDLKQEIQVSASRTAGDLKNKIFSYIDNVVISQGSLKIRADLVQVITNQDTEPKTYVAKGSPATFEQILEDGTPIYLQANEITYEPAKNTIVISGNAELRQAGSMVKSSVITYNLLTEQVLADSKDNERVQTTLQPKQLEKLKK